MKDIEHGNVTLADLIFQHSLYCQRTALCLKRVCDCILTKCKGKEISKPLAIDFNLSITTGKVPNQLKSAKVIPIYKKDDAEIYSNYRPVSVLPSFSKILERLIFDRCVDHLEKNMIY